MVDILWQKARFVCFLFVLVVGQNSSLQISLVGESFELASPGNLSQEGVTWRLWFSLQIFSKKSLFWEVLEPLLWWNLFFNLGGWDELKCVYWNVSVGLKCVRISRTESFRNLSPLEIVVSRNVVSVSEISAVNFIVGWWLLACSMNCDIYFYSVYGPE